MAKTGAVTFGPLPTASCPWCGGVIYDRGYECNHTLICWRCAKRTTQTSNPRAVRVVMAAGGGWCVVAEEPKR